MKTRRSILNGVLGATCDDGTICPPEIDGRLARVFGSKQSETMDLTLNSHTAYIFQHAV